LGCTFYYLLTGQPPFSGGTMAEKLVKHQQAEPPALAEHYPELTAIVRKMMAKRPADRYQTPGEVAQALAELPRRTVVTRWSAAGRRSVKQRKFGFIAGAIFIF